MLFFSWMTVVYVFIFTFLCISTYSLCFYHPWYHYGWFLFLFISLKIVSEIIQKNNTKKHHYFIQCWLTPFFCFISFFCFCFYFFMLSWNFHLCIHKCRNIFFVWFCLHMIRGKIPPQKPHKKQNKKPTKNKKAICSFKNFPTMSYDFYWNYSCLFLVWHCKKFFFFFYFLVSVIGLYNLYFLSLSSFLSFCFKISYLSVYFKKHVFKRSIFFKWLWCWFLFEE